MSGLSGATVAPFAVNTVLKSGGDATRTRDQGIWLQRHTTKSMPIIYSILRDGYVMEQLHPIPSSQVKAVSVLTILEEEVWSQPGECEAGPSINDVSPLTQKLQRILDVHGDPSIDDAVIAAAKAAYQKGRDWQCLSHGDPTAENVMERLMWGPVLVDPIPATVAVYDSAAVDVGKMLQSAYGWEQIKRQPGPPNMWWSVKTIEDLLADRPGLFEAGCAWAVVHLARTLPYITESMREEVINAIRDASLRV